YRRHGRSGKAARAAQNTPVRGACAGGSVIIPRIRAGKSEGTTEPDAPRGPDHAEGICLIRAGRGLLLSHPAFEEALLFGPQVMQPLAVDRLGALLVVAPRIGLAGAAFQDGPIDP